MYQYKALYALEVGPGILLEKKGTACVLYDNLTDAQIAASHIPVLKVRAVDYYDYSKKRRLTTERPEQFYKRVSELIHNKDKTIDFRN